MIAAAIALAGCQTDGTSNIPAKALKPLSDRMISDIEQKNMDKESPILVRVFKQESEFEVWKKDRTGRFALLKTYPICRWSGELGPKTKEGDRQAPEGFYTINPGQMNPNSQFYLSFDLGYPNAFDRSHGRTGMHLMVHGDCSSRGCYSMTDEQITEIYGLGREAFFGGQRSFQVQAYPFRMTAQNFAKHRGNPNMPFWRMLKQGNDHFEVTKLEPKVDVCEKRYVFDAQNPGDASRPLSFSSANKCPVFEVPAEVANAVKEKQRRDDVQIAELVSRGTPVAPVRTNADGGMHPVFAEAVKRNEVGVAPNAFSLASVPGTIPATVRPPRTADFPDPESAVVSSSSPSTVRMAIAPDPSMGASSPSPEATSSTSGGSLFGNMFSSNSKSSADSKKKEDGPIDRMARLMGLRSSDPEPKPQPAAATAAKPKPAPRSQTAAHGAIRPATAQAAAAPPAARTAHAAPDAERQRPATVAAAPAPAAPPSPTLAGAAPTVPTGSFDTRWSGFR